MAGPGLVKPPVNFNGGFAADFWFGLGCLTYLVECYDMGTGSFLHLNVRLLEDGWPNMCVANVCHHLSGLAWQFLMPGHYQNWWLHWLLIIKMSVSQIHDIWIIYFVSQWVGGWEIGFPKSHGSYPDNVCKLQLYGTYMYVIIGCQYLSGLDCHFFFLNP